MTDQSLNPQIVTAKPVSRSKSAVSPFDLAGALQRTSQALTRLVRRRRDRAHLSELPDYLLVDVGLSREDIPGTPAVGEEWR